MTLESTDSRGIRDVTGHRVERLLSFSGEATNTARATTQKNKRRVTGLAGMGGRPRIVITRPQAKSSENGGSAPGSFFFGNDTANFLPKPIQTFEVEITLVIICVAISTLAFCGKTSA